jgi:tRNA G18 (ribose-2'-O)-methylase SpoU
MTFPVSVLLENIRSLHNVGSIFRTSDGAGVEQIFLTGYTGTPPRIQIDKVALGAQKTIPWKQYKRPMNGIKKLKAAGVQIVALETGDDAIDIYDFKPVWPMALIVGNEVEGISDQLLETSDIKIKLPMNGQKESLNVSCAFTAAIYELRRKWDSQ